MAFIFDPSKGQTPQSVARQREIAARLMGQIGSMPARNVGEGIGSALSSIANGFGVRKLNKRSDAAEAEGRQGADSLYNQLIGALTGGGGIAPAPMNYSPAEPAQPMTPDQRVAQAFSDQQSPFPGQAGEIENYIRQSAAARGIDPDTAVKVAMSEGGVTDPFRQSDFVKDGKREESFGPLQLYMGGGLGNEALAAGIDPRKDWKGGVDFGLDHAKENGWGAWYGAKNVGVNGMDGIGGARPMNTGGTGAQVAQAGGGIPLAELMQAASNPWLNEGQRAGINMLIEQQMKQADPSNQLDMQYRRAQIDKLGRDAVNGDETFFGNPVAVNNPDGSVGYGQIGNKGTFKSIQLGQGQTFAPPTKSIDAGTETILMDQSGNVIGRVPKNLKQAEIDKKVGQGQGDAQNDYDSITSKMPGLYGVVDRLQGLAKQATYTRAGKILDAAGRELGMEPREAAVARAEYTAIVDNQILPLLRDTFGAQFTAEEGQRLARTLGDPDKSPTEKAALLRAFIEQKERDIQALGNRLGKTTDEGWSDRGNGIKIRRKQ